MGDGVEGSWVFVFLGGTRGVAGWVGLGLGCHGGKCVMRSFEWNLIFLQWGTLSCSADL